MMSEAKSKVLQIIDENPVAVFSKSRCPYCTQTKDLLRDLGAKFYVVELDKIGAFTIPPFVDSITLYDGSAMQAALKEINGQSTVPNIYIQKKHIGGNSHLQAMKSELHTLLAEAGAL
ncbi:hypothetical protein Golomagni_01258 [Golovinomyces magnicellulatus]|nr:hypothetical protein Golomagni_01258 [Golovinomyces magnicellulatus]